MPIPLIPIAAALASQFIPDLVGKVLGDETGKVAKRVIDIGLDAAGVENPEQIAERLHADPNLELAFRRQIESNRLELERLVQQDREDARDRDLELRRMGASNWRADAMVILDVAGLIAALAMTGFLVYLEYSNVDFDVPDIAWVTLGGLITHFANGLRDVHVFEFGSSRGSKDKDQLMAGRQPRQ